MKENFELYHYLTKHSKTQKNLTKNTMIVVDLKNECIIKITNNIHESLPQNFYIPNPNNIFYNNFENLLFGKFNMQMHKNIEKCGKNLKNILQKKENKQYNRFLNNQNYIKLKTSADVKMKQNKYVNTYDVPFIQNVDFIQSLPIYFHKTLHSNLDLHSLPLKPKIFAEKKENRIICFDWNGSVPNNQNESEDMITSYLRSILLDNPILNKRHKTLMADEFFIKTGFKTSQTSIYKKLPLLCYYMKKGPFNKCWIRFGYDPRLHKDSYKYQRLMRYKLNQKIHFIFEDINLQKEIEANKESLLRYIFCTRNGWFREELINYVKKYFKEKSLKILMV